MVYAGAAGVCRDSVCRSRALAVRADGDVYSEHLTINGLFVRVDGSVWNHDQSLFVLLAGVPGSRGTGGRRGREAPEAGSGAGTGTTRGDADRYLPGDGIFQFH